MSLSDAELERYARHIILPHFGGAAQSRLRNARVAVIGAGGIGCPALQALAASGVGTLRIVDADTVSLSNLHRQPLFTDADIGQPKALVAAARLSTLNPHVVIDTRVESVTPDSVAALTTDVDVVLDGTDNFATRLIVSDHVTRAQIPLVSAAVAQFQGQVATFTGWLADAPCYRCFVGDAHDADDCDSCAEQGVLGAMAAMVGSFAALEVIRAVTSFGDAAVGKLHIWDGLAPSARTIRLPKDPACRTCAVPEAAH